MVEIESGHVTLGKERGHYLYGWDNEYGHQEVDVASFKVSKYLVSNGEFMAFVEEDGYENGVYWDEEGKKFLEIRGAKYLVFWVKQPHGEYRYRALEKIIDIRRLFHPDVRRKAYYHEGRVVD